jgi:hypothetical protein
MTYMSITSFAKHHGSIAIRRFHFWDPTLRPAGPRQSCRPRSTAAVWDACVPPAWPVRAIKHLSPNGSGMPMPWDYTFTPKNLPKKNYYDNFYYEFNFCIFLGGAIIEVWVSHGLSMIITEELGQGLAILQWG